MTERDMLLRAVLEDPGDDTVRLVYADWLDENGEPGRAEFIRLAVNHPSYSFVALTKDDPFPLLGFPPGPAVEPYADRLPPDCHNPQTWLYSNNPEHGAAVWDLGRNVWYYEERGFIKTLRCPAASFTEGVARELFSKHPVMKVALNDREPLNLTSNLDGSVCWLRDSPDYVNPPHSPLDRATIPAHLFDLIVAFDRLAPLHPRQLRYRNTVDALAHLSDACCLWGRSLVKPPLRGRQLSGHTT